MRTQYFQIEERGPIETFALRLMFSLVVLWTLPTVAQLGELTAQEDPVGIARIIDLTFLASPPVYHTLRFLIAGSLLLYTAGWAMRVSLGVATLGHIAVFTLYNSQGVAYHSQNIISLMLLAQWLVFLWPATCKLGGNPTPARASDTSLHYAIIVIVGVYLVTGVTKLIVSKGLWIYESPWVAVELLKTNAQNYYNWLEIDAAYAHRQVVAEWIVAHPNLSRLLLGSGLLIELLAFLGLRDRIWALAAGLSLIALHWGIDATMGLFFQYNVAVIIIFLVNPVFWVLRGAEYVTKNRSTPS